MCADLAWFCIFIKLAIDKLEIRIVFMNHVSRFVTGHKSFKRQSLKYVT